MLYYKGDKHKNELLPLNELLAWKNDASKKNSEGNSAWYDDSHDLQQDKIKIHLLLEGVRLNHRLEIKYIPLTPEERKRYERFQQEMFIYKTQIYIILKM